MAPSAAPSVRESPRHSDDFDYLRELYPKVRGGMAPVSPVFSSVSQKLAGGDGVQRCTCRVPFPPSPASGLCLHAGLLEAAQCHSASNVCFVERGAKPGCCGTTARKRNVAGYARC